MSEKSNNHIGEDGLYTPDGLDYIFDKGFMHNCYLDGEKFDCESEVSPFAVSIYQNKYHFLKDYWKIECFISKGQGDNNTKLLNPRRQMSTRGSFLTKDYEFYKKEKYPREVYTTDWKSFDVVGDIITSIESNSKIGLKKIEDNNSDDIIVKLKLRKPLTEVKNFNKAFVKFCFTVGTIGNMIVSPEGANRRREENIIDLVNYWQNAIDSYEEYLKDKGFISSINNHFTNKYTFGRMTRIGDTISGDIGKKIYSYWFHNDIESPNCSLDFIIHDNFFNDSFETNNKKIKKSYLKPENNNENEWNKWYLSNLKLIIERGYRIWYSGKGENGIAFNDKRMFSQIASKEPNNLHVMRVKQVIYHLEKLASGDKEPFEEADIKSDKYKQYLSNINDIKLV